jgi:hypothetical protein
MFVARISLGDRVWSGGVELTDQTSTRKKNLKKLVHGKKSSGVHGQ